MNIIKTKSNFSLLLMNFFVAVTFANPSNLNAGELKSNESCEQLESKIKEKDQAIHEKYLKLDSEGLGIKEDNRSYFKEGNRHEGVLLQHGFLASPFEILPLAKELNRLGYTVYAPLLYGYGSSTTITNLIGEEGWISGFEESALLFQKCFKKFHLVGFSLGGGLSGRFAYNHPEMIKSLTLISPYFKVGLIGASVIVQMVKNIQQTDRLAIESFPNIGDLKALKKYPQYYNHDFALNAAKNLIKFGENLQNIPNEKLDNTFPVLIQLSENDQSVDQKQAFQWPKNHFNNVKTSLLRKKLDIPHQILLKDFNEYHEKTINELLYFIETFKQNTKN